MEYNGIKIEKGDAELVVNILRGLISSSSLSHYIASIKDNSITFTNLYASYKNNVQKENDLLTRFIQQSSESIQLIINHVKKTILEEKSRKTNRCFDPHAGGRRKKK